jgi:hypothetical protein
MDELHPPLELREFLLVRRGSKPTRIESLGAVDYRLKDFVVGLPANMPAEQREKLLRHAGRPFFFVRPGVFKKAGADLHVARHSSHWLPSLALGLRLGSALCLVASIKYMAMGTAFGGLIVGAVADPAALRDLSHPAKSAIAYVFAKEMVDVPEVDDAARAANAAFKAWRLQENAK